MFRLIISVLLLFVGVATPSWAQGSKTMTSPKLVVNIIVGGMRAGDIDRYKSLFGSAGLLHLQQKGVNFSSASYSFSPLSTSASLATLMTGATPSTHGVIGDSWWNRISASRVELAHDEQAKGINYNLHDHSYSAERLIAPSLTDALLDKNRDSKLISISLEPTPAVVMSSERGTPYWIDELSCEWGSSTAFMETLPKWVEAYNKSTKISNIASETWVSRMPKSFYNNTISTTLTSRSDARKYESKPLRISGSRLEQVIQSYNQLKYTPAGNRAILDYARQVIESEDLGQDKCADILNIYLDPARYIAQRYGTGSVESEDMFAQLDGQIEAFLKFLDSQKFSNNIVVTLTSDHGMSPSHGDKGEAKGRFDAKQFVVVTNSFLRARYGGEKWVMGYEHGNVYLDHREIFRNKLSVEDVQNEVASFALQFRGVSHAFTATALRNSSSFTGHGEVVQRGFYPRRSGDITILLMPGWIEQSDDNIASSGSAYRYDRYVPLIIYGREYTHGATISHEVNMVSFASTIAHILGIEPPAASESGAIEEIQNLF